jgi:hypothetical protein
MRSIVTTLSAIAMLFIAGSANAQNLNQIEVNVPFAFAAAGRVLAPGMYRLSINPSNQIITLSGEPSTTLFLASAQPDQLQHDRTFLRFYGSENERVLGDVVVAGIVRKIRSADQEKTFLASRKQLEQPGAGTGTPAVEINLTSRGKEN